MRKGELGAAGRKMLLEETLEGQELSFIILTDGTVTRRSFPPGITSAFSTATVGPTPAAWELSPRMICSPTLFAGKSRGQLSSRPFADLPTTGFATRDSST